MLCCHSLCRRYEQKLAQEKDDKVRLRGQAGIHQKHHHDLKLSRNLGIAVLCQVEIMFGTCFKLMREL